MPSAKTRRSASATEMATGTAPDVERGPDGLVERALLGDARRREPSMRGKVEHVTFRSAQPSQCSVEGRVGGHAVTLRRGSTSATMRANRLFGTSSATALASAKVSTSRSRGSSLTREAQGEEALVLIVGRGRCRHGHALERACPPSPEADRPVPAVVGAPEDRVDVHAFEAATRLLEQLRRESGGCPSRRPGPDR